MNLSRRLTPIVGKNVRDKTELRSLGDGSYYRLTRWNEKVAKVATPLVISDASVSNVTKVFKLTTVVSEITTFRFYCWWNLAKPAFRRYSWPRSGKLCSHRYISCGVIIAFHLVDLWMRLSSRWDQFHMAMKSHYFQHETRLTRHWIGERFLISSWRFFSEMRSRWLLRDRSSCITSAICRSRSSRSFCSNNRVCKQWKTELHN